MKNRKSRNSIRFSHVLARHHLSYGSIGYSIGLFGEVWSFKFIFFFSKDIRNLKYFEIFCSYMLNAMFFDVSCYCFFDPSLLLKTNLLFHQVNFETNLRLLGVPVHPIHTMFIRCKTSKYLMNWHTMLTRL